VLNYVQKQSTELFPVPIDFGARIPSSVTILTGTAAAIKMSDGTTASSTVLVSTTLAISGTEAAATVKAGTDGEAYSISYSVTLSNSAVLKETFRMLVKDEI